MWFPAFPGKFRSDASKSSYPSDKKYLSAGTGRKKTRTLAAAPAARPAVTHRTRDQPASQPASTTTGHGQQS